MPRLLDALDHPIWRVRAAAAFALRLIGDSSAIARMQRALGDAAWQVRVPALEFLGDMHDARSRVAIEPLLRDRHILVRETAQAALAASIH
jgi:HEAT repeat protein